MINTNVIDKIYERNELLWGNEVQKMLFTKHVMIFGLGGVGSYAVDALARSGIGELTIVDFDTVAESNINRQLLALIPDIGKSKVELMKSRIEAINPHIKVNIIKDFYTPNLNKYIFSNKIDFVVDAIDSLKYKIDLIVSCTNQEIPIITSMGAANRLDPEQLYIADISQIKKNKCSFENNIRYKLKTRGITEGLPVVASTEKPAVKTKNLNTQTITTKDGEELQLMKITPASSPFVPPRSWLFNGKLCGQKVL